MGSSTQASYFSRGRVEVKNAFGPGMHDHRNRFLERFFYDAGIFLCNSSPELYLGGVDLGAQGIVSGLLLLVLTITFLC